MTQNRSLFRTTVLAILLSFGAMVSTATAETPQIYLTCSPVDGIPDCGEGRRFDTVKCGCVPVDADDKIKLPNQCLLTCPIGTLDAEQCRCIDTDS